MIANDQELVQKSLMKSCDQPFSSFMQEKDFKIALELFTKIAVSSAKKLDLIEFKQLGRSPNLSDKKKFPQSDALVRITEKIKIFSEKYAYDFWRAYNGGFPFSMLDPTTSKKALKKALRSNNSIIVHLFKQDHSDWLTEGELDLKFGEAFKRFHPGEIREACSDLKRAYTSNHDDEAGYYLLWLIKRFAECDFEIPPKSTFGPSTVKSVLTQLILSQPTSSRFPNRLLDILYFRSSRLETALHQSLLKPTCQGIFLQYTVNQLQAIPMSAWPNKGNLIVELLTTVAAQTKAVIAQDLQSSADAETSKVGGHILNALHAISIKAAIPHYYALTELLDNFTGTDIELVFRSPFPTFREHSHFRKDPEFTRRLQFNGMRKVFISGNLMIGVYNTLISFGGSRVPPHLLAYNMKTEKMEWGVPLTPAPFKEAALDSNQTPMTFGLSRMKPASYELSHVGEEIALRFTGQQKVYLLDASSGELKKSIELPYPKRDSSEYLYINPNGFAYQVAQLKRNRKLIGGKLFQTKFIPSFEVETPSGLFLRLSTHVGFLKTFQKKLVLFKPTGKFVVIDCLSARAYGNKLYTIESNSSVTNTCQLTIRTMIADHRVVSDPEKRIILKTMEASINCLADNEEMILFSENSSSRSPIFLNLLSEEIVYCKHKAQCYATYVTNDVTGELWTWDQISKKIWKITSKETVLAGTLESGRGTTLLHADSSGHLYFTDIPY